MVQGSCANTIPGALLMSWMGLSHNDYPERSLTHSAIFHRIRLAEILLFDCGAYGRLQGLLRGLHFVLEARVAPVS
jgi:hypothetical protein